LDTDFVHDLFASFRPVELRNMFGGTGISIDGITFAIAFSGVIFLKADDETIPAFEREGCKPFVYPLAKMSRTRKKPSTFWRMPERLYDDPDELAVWAERSLAVAQRKKIAG
jgi:DNA transformation protein